MDHHIPAIRAAHRRPWTDADDALLKTLILGGELIGPIAMALGRTREAVRNRANSLGLSVHSSPGRGRRRLDGAAPA